MTFSKEQAHTLQLINGTILLSFLFNLAFIAHNLYRYIFRLKIYRPLILMFYGFVLLATLLRIVE